MSVPARVRRVAGLTAAGLAAAALLAMQAGPAHAEPGKIRNADARGAITDSYIVVFKNSAVGKDKTRPTTDRLATKHRAEVKYRYGKRAAGLRRTMTEGPGQAARRRPDRGVRRAGPHRAGRRHPDPDALVGPGPHRPAQPAAEQQLHLPEHRGPTSRAYIIDTGIRTTHTDFGGRAVWGTNTTGDGNNTDCNGHGTHVAGTVGGTAYGVAKGVRLVAVKVLNCAGSGIASPVSPPASTG